MSLPHCPSTLLVVRHGDAEYDRPDVPGDDGGRLTAAGAAQTERLAADLQGRRVAAIYASPLQRARETGLVLGRRLGLDCRELAGVEEFRVGAYAGREDGHDLVGAVFDRWLAGDLDAGCPGGESARRVVGRFRSAGEWVADQFRGEAVAVISHGGAMSLALPRLCGRPELGRARWLPHCSVAEVSVGSDGWEMVAWPGFEDSDRADSAG